MADNPRLVIELEDRTNANGIAATNPSVPGSANVPGSDVVSEFHKNVSEKGAGSTIPPAQSTPTSDLVTTALDNQNRQSTELKPTSVNPLTVNPNAADRPVNAVISLLQAEPNLTAEDLRSILGFKDQIAQQLLDQAREVLNRQQNQQTSTPNVPPPQPPANTGPSSGYETDGMHPTGTQMPRGSYIDPVTGLPESEPVNTRPSSGYETEPSKSQRPVVTTRAPQIDPATGLVLEEDKEGPKNATGRQVADVIQSAIQLSGLQSTQIGNMAGKATSLIPSLLPETGLASSSLASMASTALPIIAAGGTALSLAAAAYGMVDNEAKRAVRISSEYSPEAITALARDEVRQIFANMKTAGILGDEAADYVEVKGRISGSLQSIRDSVGEPLIQSLNTNLNTLATILEGLDKTFGKKENGQSTALGGAGFALGEYLQMLFYNSFAAGPYGFAIAKIVNWLSSKADEDAAGRNQEDFYDWLHLNLQHLQPPAPFNAAGAQSGMEPLGVKIAPIPGLQL